MALLTYSRIHVFTLLFWRIQPARLVIDRDLVLKDFLHDDLQVRHGVLALDERAGAVHQFEHALLDEGGQFESAADLVHDFVAFECFNHNYCDASERLCLMILLMSSTARSTVSFTTMNSNARLPLAM